MKLFLTSFFWLNHFRLKNAFEVCVKFCDMMTTVLLFSRWHENKCPYCMYHAHNFIKHDAIVLFACSRTRWNKLSHLNSHLNFVKGVVHFDTWQNGKCFQSALDWFMGPLWISVKQNLKVQVHRGKYRISQLRLHQICSSFWYLARQPSLRYWTRAAFLLEWI